MIKKAKKDEDAEREMERERERAERKRRRRRRRGQEDGDDETLMFLHTWKQSDILKFVENNIANFESVYVTQRYVDQRKMDAGHESEVKHSSKERGSGSG